MKRAFVFDLDGTLVESLPGIAGSLNRTLTMHGLPQHSHQAVRGFIGDGAKMLLTRAMGRAVSSVNLESALRCFSADYGLSWPEGTIVFEGISELIADLHEKQIPMAVLSNKPHDFTVEIVTRLFPELPFAAVLGNREGLPHKPDPQGALEIRQQLGIPPEMITVIGDSRMDIDTAKNACMGSIAVTWGYQDISQLSHADHVVNQVAELKQLIAELSLVKL